MDQRNAPDSRIELDLEPGAGAPESRRQRPMVESVAYERPRLEAVLREDDLGSDETERTVGILLLVSLLPDLLFVVLGHGSLSLISFILPGILAWGLIQGEEWARAYVFWACLAQLVLAPALVFAAPHAALLVTASVLRNGGLLMLVAGRSLTRPFYFAALGAVALGVLLGVAGAFLR